MALIQKYGCWIWDLPANITCPPVIDSMPDHTYSYISNNFEFDNNGDLWSFSNYNDTTGQCNMDKFDVNTGNVINTRLVQFPAGNFPTSISSGDFTILPNGRMFATLGAFLHGCMKLKIIAAPQPMRQQLSWIHYPKVVLALLTSTGYSKLPAPIFQATVIIINIILPPKPWIPQKISRMVSCLLTIPASLLLLELPNNY